MSTTSTPVVKKKPVFFHKSKLLNDLENYDPQPSAELQRKIDFYITPYNKDLLVGKHMTFDEPEQIIWDGRSRSTDLCFQDPVGQCYWTYFVKRLFNKKNISYKELKQLERRVLLQANCQTDYLTKLDLIDQYPHLFTEKGSLMSADEIEQLRILVVGE